MDVKQLLKDIDSRIASNPSSTARSLAQELNVPTRIIEQAVLEADGVSFNEYLETRQLARVLKTLEDRREAQNRNERAIPRKTIPGATVTYSLHGHASRKHGSSVSYPIFDLSRGGMAFLSDRPLKPGRRISLFLKCPDTKDAIRLEGDVVYSLVADISGYQYRSGVRFVPFEAKEGCNPPEILEVLAKLLETAISPAHGSG
jgi:hypothetical protein